MMFIHGYSMTLLIILIVHQEEICPNTSCFQVLLVMGSRSFPHAVGDRLGLLLRLEVDALFLVRAAVISRGFMYEQLVKRR